MVIHSLRNKETIKAANGSYLVIRNLNLLGLMPSGLNSKSGEIHFDMEDGADKPSRWNTLRAMRALNWYSAPD